MSDYNSSLPVRTENNGDVVAKLVDGTLTTQYLGIDASGRIVVKLADKNGVGIDSQTISTTQWLQVVNPSSGPAAPGTAAAFSQLAGGIYKATLPTLTDTQQASLQLDSRGRLIVATQSSNDTNYGTVGANTLRTAAQIGNATGAADFNFGAASAQTLRVASLIGNATGAADFNYGVIGAQSLRVASQIGNATGAADFNAGATGAQTLRVTANQGAPNTIANRWPVQGTDGTNSQSYTATGEAKVIVTSPLPAGTNSIGTVVVSNFPTTVDTNYGTVGANTLRTAAQIGNATGAADFNNGATTAQTLRVAANLAVAGANVSNTNPVPVYISNTVPGSEVLDYKTVASLAAAASDTHLYTVLAGETLTLQQVSASGSGKIKVEIKLGANTKVVLFNSTAYPNVNYIFQAPQLVAAAGTVSVIVTNLDKQAQDIYSTIEGVNNP